MINKWGMPPFVPLFCINCLFLQTTGFRLYNIHCVLKHFLQSETRTTFVFFFQISNFLLTVRRSNYVNIFCPAPLSCMYVVRSKHDKWYIILLFICTRKFLLHGRITNLLENIGSKVLDIGIRHSLRSPEVRQIPLITFILENLFLVLTKKQARRQNLAAGGRKKQKEGPYC